MFQDVKTAHGATGNGTTDDRAAFVAADGTAGTIYVPEGTYRIASNLTLSSDIRFEQGAKLKPASGVAVTLNGSLDAGIFPVFDLSAGGSVLPNRSEQYVVQWWGATGNGSTDDYAAIAAALEASRQRTSGGPVIFFPAGTYRITTPLNCTGGYYTLRGDGMFRTNIKGDTGGNNAIIELVGSAYSQVEAMTLQGGTTNASGTGVLLARIKDWQGVAAQSWFVNLRDLAVWMGTSTTANAGQGTIGIYNYGCEVSDIHDVYCIADTALVYAAGNVMNLSSVHRLPSAQYGMFTGDTSMTACTVTGNNMLVGGRGPAVLLGGAANIYIQAHLNRLFEATSSLYAINVLGQVTDFEYRGSNETYPVVLRNQSLITGMRLHAYSGWDLTYPRVYLDRIPNQPSHATIRDSVIDVIPTPDSLVGSTPVATGYLIDTTADMASQVIGCQLWLRWGKVRIQNPWANSNLTGNTVHFLGPLANVVFQAPVEDGNVFVCADQFASSKLSVANAATASTPGTVVKKIEVFDAAGASLGFVPVYNSIT